jgi:hypothetical protein
MGTFCVESVCVPGPKTSAALPSLTSTAAWPGRQMSFAPFLTSWSSSGKRHTKV